MRNSSKSSTPLVTSLGCASQKAVVTVQSANTSDLKRSAGTTFLYVGMEAIKFPLQPTVTAAMSSSQRKAKRNSRTQPLKTFETGQTKH